MTKENFLSQILHQKPRFWMLNLLQMIERLAYWIVTLQMPIYIAQKDALGGLHWDQSVKGVIFFIWALTQNLTPVFTGVFADRYGRRKVMFAAISLAIMGFVIMGTQRQMTGFIAGTVVLGFGLGMFKPALQGAVAATLNKRAAVGWGLYIMLLNFAVFFGAPISKALKEISWQSVFFGSAVIIALNLIFILFLKKDAKSENETNQTISFVDLPRKIISHFSIPKVWQFVLIISGFMIIYMQFYESLPNFIFDWIDTSSVATSLGLPDSMTIELNRGRMISYEWLFSLNSAFIVVAIAFISWLLSRYEKVNVISAGLFISTLGLALCGLSSLGSLLILGILVYTLGEMITNPKINEYISDIAPREDKSLYLSFMSISWTIGLAGGALLGGKLYKILGEKAHFAQRYLTEELHLDTHVPINEAFPLLIEFTGLNASEATTLLWNFYNPAAFWYPFLFIGLISAIGMVLYRNAYYGKSS